MITGYLDPMGMAYSMITARVSSPGALQLATLP